MCASAALLTVVVAVAAGTPFTTVGVLLDRQGGADARDIEKGKPQEVALSLQIPMGELGPYEVTAYAVAEKKNQNDENEEPVAGFSDPITIDVETRAAITALKVTPVGIPFRFAGEQDPLLVQGTFDDASKPTLRESSKTIYRSADERIAVVNASGMVTATGGGATTITVTYDTKSVQIPVTVPVIVRDDLDGDGDVDQEDAEILRARIEAGARPTTSSGARKLKQNPGIELLDMNVQVSVTVRGDLDADGDVDQADANTLLADIQAGVRPTGTFDARDLNQDGVINQLDVDALRRLCTRPNCAIYDEP